MAETAKQSAPFAKDIAPRPMQTMESAVAFSQPETTNASWTRAERRSLRGEPQRPSATRATSSVEGSSWTRGEGRPVDRHLQMRDGAAGDSSSMHATAQEGLSGPGGAIPHAAALQASFGDTLDVSSISAHTDKKAQQANAALGSNGFAYGSSVALKSTDLFTTAHEAAHVAQQKAGVSLSSGVGRQGDAYEQHADKVASAVVKGESAAELLSDLPGKGADDKAVQRSDAGRSLQLNKDEDVPSAGAPSAQDQAPVEAGPRSTEENKQKESAKGDVRSYDDLKVLLPGDIAARYPGDEKGNPAPHRDAAVPHKILFGGDWFLAQDVLLAGKVPGWQPQEAQSHEPNLKALMRGLHGLRKTETDDTLTQVREDLKKDASVTAKLGAKFTDKQVLDWAAAGSESLTSDIDVNLKGAGSIKAVTAFNTKFKQGGGWAKEAGIVFDVNVYAKDFMEEWPPFDLVDKATDQTIKAGDAAGKDVSMVPHQEVKLDTQSFNNFSGDQEVWSYVKMRIYMSDSEWDAYMRTQIAGVQPTERAALQKKFDDATTRYALYEFEIETQMSQIVQNAGGAYTELLAALNVGKEVAARAVGGHAAEEQQQSALRMRASNMLYEQKLIKVQALRDELQTLMAMPPVARAMAKRSVPIVGLALKKALSDAITYSNEAYFTQGSVHFAVLGKQVGGKMATEKGMNSLEVDLPPDMLFHSFNENVGFTLEKLNHYADLPANKTWKGAYKAGKYIDRMMDSAVRLPGVDPSGAEFMSMLELGHKAAALKAGDAPDSMAEVEINKLIGQTSMAALRTSILNLGAQIGTVYRKNRPKSQSLQDRREAPPVKPDASSDEAQMQLSVHIGKARISEQEILAFLSRIPPKPGPN